MRIYEIMWLGATPSDVLSSRRIETKSMEEAIGKALTMMRRRSEPAWPGPKAPELANGLHVREAVRRCP